MKIIHFWVTAVLLFLSCTIQAAEIAGKVGYMSGALVAQRTDGTVKVLASKSDVMTGDLLITGKDSYAQIQLNDGSKMTLRPNSNLRIEEFTFVKESPQTDNIALRLLKGGFRTLTGLIGKRGNADAFQLNTATATIGIRGTNFTTRVCTNKNCEEEDAEKSKLAIPAPINQSQVVGRVMLIQGEFSAKDSSAKLRKLALGGPVYEGDELATGKESRAVVAFRDESRVSLQASTVFHVQKFKYEKNTTQENAVLRLLKGGVRVLTGLIGHVNRDRYEFHVATATIGIRGTGFDAWCNGACASGAGHPGATQSAPLDGAGVFVWSGEVALVTNCATTGSCPTQIVGVQQAAIIARGTGTPTPVNAIPPNIINNDTPRPDSVPADTQKLFGTESSNGEPGVYVTVHDGNVIMAQSDKKLDLGRGETGYSSPTKLVRLPEAPAFMAGEPQQINSGSGNQKANPNSTNPSLNPSGCAVQ